MFIVKCTCIEILKSNLKVITMSAGFFKPNLTCVFETSITTLSAIFLLNNVKSFLMSHWYYHGRSYRNLFLLFHLATTGSHTLIWFLRFFSIQHLTNFNFILTQESTLIISHLLNSWVSLNICGHRKEIWKLTFRALALHQWEWMLSIPYPVSS